MRKSSPKGVLLFLMETVVRAAISDQALGWFDRLRIFSVSRYAGLHYIGCVGYSVRR
jgi:hypothetical protein